MEKPNKDKLLIKKFEDFIETKNKYIQSILLCIVTISGVAYGFVSPEMQGTIRYTLVANLFIELYILQVKDSILQDKVNWARVDVQRLDGGLRFEKEIDVKDYFCDAQNDLFVSGIAINRFLEKYREELCNLLKSNKKMKVYFLISSLEAIPENSAQYHGCKNKTDDKSKNLQKELMAKVEQTLLIIKNNQELNEAFLNGKLVLQTTNIVFTISCVAYDIFVKKNQKGGKIKVSFYQQGEHQVGDIPSVELEVDRNGRDMYPYFKKVIQHQWETGERVLGCDKLNEFYESIQKKKNEI